MKVALLINTLSAGGAELHLLTLARHLYRRGLAVHVGYFKEVPGSRPLRGDFAAAHVTVTDLQGARAWDIAHLQRVVRWVREAQPHILHTHLPRADFAGWFVKLLNPSLVWVASVHAVYGRRAWRGRWALPMFRIVWARADAIIAISNAVKAWLVGHMRISAEKVRVVPYGIDLKPFEKSFPFTKADDAFCVGTMGRLDPDKGHDVLIRAMSFIVDRYPHIRLYIAGHDPSGYGAQLRRLIAELGLEEHVRLPGFVQNVPRFMNGLDVFALASRTEGFGQVVIEAMAAGKPVIASGISPFTEIIIDGVTGVLVPPEQPEAFAEAVERLLLSPDTRKEMGVHGRRRVEAHFSAERMTDAVIGVYRELGVFV